ncbi:MAG TPA: PIG-L family deacetylase [Phycisphaerae bacterium]|mgnify:CR=1 FL=1|nr:PIG-L family deacetylase [Phycisphaerae bacterium]
MSTDRLDIVFTAPHPDDLEIGMGGAIARCVQQGYRVGMFHMTNGEPTPRGTPETRAEETHAAAEILGAHVCETLTMPNRVLMDCPENRYVLATVLRRYKPKVLVGMAGRTVAASPDHYQAQLITEAARFYSQLTKWDDRFGGTEPHRMDHLLYRVVPMAAETNFFPSRIVVDIGDTIEKKLEAVRAYRSQFDGVRLAHVEHVIRSIAGYEGAMAGFAYGEAYAVPRPIGTSDLMAALGEWGPPPPFDPLAPPRANAAG